MSNIPDFCFFSVRPWGADPPQARNEAQAAIKGWWPQPAVERDSAAHGLFFFTALLSDGFFHPITPRLDCCSRPRNERVGGRSDVIGKLTCIDICFLDLALDNLVAAASDRCAEDRNVVNVIRHR